MNNYVFNYDQYKKTINKKNKTSFLLLFFIVIILLGLCIFIYPKKSNTIEFYFVEIDNFQTFKEANNLSLKINESGGAGYVYFDGKYRVLASFYSNYDNAKKVADNLKNDYTNATVFTMETNNFHNIINLNSHQNNSIKNLLETTYKTILQLEDLIINYELKNISNNELNLHIKNHQTEFDEVYNDFINNFNNLSKYNLAKDYLVKMQQCFKNISTIENQNISSNLRYETVKLVILRSQFLSCF